MVTIISTPLEGREFGQELEIEILALFQLLKVHSCITQVFLMKQEEEVREMERNGVTPM